MYFMWSGTIRFRVPLVFDDWNSMIHIYSSFIISASDDDILDK